MASSRQPCEKCGVKLSDNFESKKTFGWARTVGRMAQTVYRGVEQVRPRLILTMAASNLARLPRLLAA